MQLTCVARPLEDAAGLARVRLATYQSMSGAGDAGHREAEGPRAGGADLGMDWELDGDEFSEEWKLREESRKILGLPDLPLHASCVRVPVLVGHAQAVWVETKDTAFPGRGRAALAAAPHVELSDAVCRARWPARTPSTWAGETRPHRRERPRPLGRQRQPAQGRRAERGSDRRDVDRARAQWGERAARARRRPAALTAPSTSAPPSSYAHQPPLWWSVTVQAIARPTHVAAAANEAA